MPQLESDPLGDGLGLMGAEVFSVELEDQVTEEELEDANAPSEELQSIVTSLLEEARDHYESSIQPDQVEATDYYWARPFGDEQEGRSQVISTDLRDTILDKMPDLLDVFTSGDAVVEFKPRGEEDVPIAAQQTDTVNYIFLEDNPGYEILNAVFKDGGVRRVGWTKWWWEVQDRVRGETLHGMTQEDLQFLAQEEGVEIEVVASQVSLIPQQNPETGEVALAEVELLTVDIRREESVGEIRVMAVPPEEILYTPDARDIDSSAVFAHSREVPLDELLGMGIPLEVIKRHRGRREQTDQTLKWSRSFHGISGRDFSHAEDENHAREPVLFTEAYALVDVFGDEEDPQPAELRRFECIGPDYTIVNGPDGDLVDDIPFAGFTQEPEPHTILGLCDWDHTKDIQRIKSQIKRAQLNSLALAVEPQLEVGPGVNIGDLLSPDLSGFVRVRAPNSVREIKTTFVGPETLEILAYYDQEQADRTGTAGPREGLNPNILQSTTQEAVENTLSKSQKRVKMIAKSYAETGMKRMFKGILRLLVRHKHEWSPRAFRFRGDWVDIDPRAWDADRDVTVNVGLGTGSKSQQVQELLAIAEKQEAHIQSGSPLVSFVELRNTYQKLTELLGYRDSSMFWKRWSAEDQAQMEQQMAEAQAQGGADPAMELVKIEEVKAQAQVQLEQQKFQLDAQKETRKLELEELKIRLQDDREKDKIARDAVLAERKIEAEHQVDIRDAELRAQVQRDRQAQATQE